MITRAQIINYLLILTLILPIAFYGCSNGSAESGTTPSSDKTITAYSFVDPSVAGIINEADHTIDAAVPYGTNVTALVAVFTITGTSVSVGGTEQISGITANDFTNSVTYTVTAADSTSQEYLVSVAFEDPEAGDKAAYKVNDVSFNIIYVPATVFPAGTDDNSITSVEKSFWIGETEVTYELWYAVYEWAVNGAGSATGEGEYNFANEGTMGDGAGDNVKHPVTTIDWRDAMVFCNALTEWYNAKCGKNLTCVYFSDPGYLNPHRSSYSIPYGSSLDPNDGGFDRPYIKAASNGNLDMANCIADGFRLPTAGEWELAAKWRTDSVNTADGYSDPWFTKGNSASGASADWYDNDATAVVAVFNSSSTAEVKSKLNGYNSLGIYDMSGNVMEWCFDQYPTIDLNRICRGGCWAFASFYTQTGFIDSRTVYVYSTRLGFRTAKNK